MAKKVFIGKSKSGKVIKTTYLPPKKGNRYYKGEIVREVNVGSGKSRKRVIYTTSKFVYPKNFIKK